MAVRIMDESFFDAVSKGPTKRVLSLLNSGADVNARNSFGMTALTVDGRRFSYSFATLTAGFNETRSRNGPIRDGQPIRLAVVGDEIARVEVADAAKR